MLPPGEPVKWCLLNPLEPFLGAWDVPTLSFEGPTGEFGTPADSFDGRVDEPEVSAAGVDFLSNGLVLLDVLDSLGVASARGVLRACR